MKRTFRQYRGKKHSELRINEDLHQLIMYLMSILKRVVKYINDTRTIVKYLRRLAKKHSPLEVDLGRFDPTELASVYCTAIREILPRKDQVCPTRLYTQFGSIVVQLDWMFATSLGANCITIGISSATLASFSASRSLSFFLPFLPRSVLDNPRVLQIMTKGHVGRGGRVDVDQLFAQGRRPHIP